jgi:hypothetical protein
VRNELGSHLTGSRDGSAQPCRVVDAEALRRPPGAEHPFCWPPPSFRCKGPTPQLWSGADRFAQPERGVPAVLAPTRSEQAVPAEANVFSAQPVVTFQRTQDGVAQVLRPAAPFLGVRRRIAGKRGVSRALARLRKKGHAGTPRSKPWGASLQDGGVCDHKYIGRNPDLPNRHKPRRDHQGASSLRCNRRLAVPAGPFAFA